MPERGKTLLKGHSLVYEGNGSRLAHGVGGAEFWTAGGEIAHCTCGAASPAGLSVRKRQQWHREHKEAIRNDPAHRPS